MITEPAIAPRWLCAGALAGLSLLAALPADGLQALAWQRDAIGDGQWARMLTAHLVHLGPRHLLFNLLGLALITDLLLDDWAWPPLLGLLLASAVGTSLFLWVGEPGLRWYAGLSGLLHGLWAGAALANWQHRRCRLSTIALGLLAFKLLVLNDGAGMTPVVPVAHIYGAACGLLWALARSAPRPRPDHFD